MPANCHLIAVNRSAICVRDRLGGPAVAEKSCETSQTGVNAFMRNTDMVRHMKLRIFITQDEDGVFVSEVPELPGCVSQGNTREDAIANIKDAISGYVASLKKHNEPIPFATDEEPIEIHV